MSKTTPATWEASGVRISLGGERFLQIIGTQKDAVVAYVPYSDRTDRDHVEAHADQRLIAAAPDLLAALKALRLQALQSSVNDMSNEWGLEALAMTEAAIAKAEPHP